MKAAQRIFDRLDKISRTRALTVAESMMLENVIGEIDGPGRTRRAYRGKLHSRGGKTTWSPAQDDALRAAVASGLTFRAAGEKLGRTRGACIGRFGRIGKP